MLEVAAAIGLDALTLVQWEAGQLVPVGMRACAAASGRGHWRG